MVTKSKKVQFQTNSRFTPASKLKKKERLF